MSPSYDIFISYRREGGYDTAKHLSDLLIRDGYRVSFDIDTLRSGDFDTQLYARIDQCKDFILIVDLHAFDRTLDPKTNPQEDWFRCELAYALKQNKNIIPVFLAGVNGFPRGLPEDVIGVVKKNGPEYNRYHFNAFYTDLKKRYIKSYSLKSLIIIVFVVVFVSACVIFCYFMLGDQFQNPIADNVQVAPVDTIITESPRVEYYTKKDDDFLIPQELYAKVDGYEYRVDIPEDMCVMVAAKEDFDGDGVTDALITHVNACGGNAIGDSFFFVHYSGLGYFSISDEFGNSVWDEPIIEEWNGVKSVVIYDSNEGFNQADKNYIKERYILKQGNAIRVESSKKNSIVALKEICSSDFHNGKENKTIRMSFDLDENGIEDVFECVYWERWDKLVFKLLLNGEYSDYCHYGISRIGVLESKTKGMHDLIYDENGIAKWNGSEYVFD